MKQGLVIYTIGEVEKWRGGVVEETECWHDQIEKQMRAWSPWQLGAFHPPQDYTDFIRIFRHATVLPGYG